MKLFSPSLLALAPVRIYSLGLLLASLTFTAWAQDAATIHGLVTDPSGAVVGGATVTASSLDNRAVRSTLTNASGLYAIPQLPPGQYELRAERAGFQTVVRNNVNLTTGETANIDFALQLGAANVTVNVAADTQLLDTAGSSLSTVVQGRQIEQMPLNGRNVLNLVTLVPGVIPQGSSQGSPVGNQNGGAFSQPGGIGNYQIGGGFAGQSVIYIDGAPDNMLLQNNYVSLDPSQDSIQEFRVETNNVSARFGGFNGGVINMTTHSGSNQFHGTVYEFIRNKVLNGNNFFNNRNHIPRPAFTQNQYGASVGGPIVKNKAFAFINWENFSLREGEPLVLTVPTQLMREGNFSEQPNPIYDPCGGTVAAGGQGCPAYTGPRTPFPGKQIPLTRFDPTAAIMLNFFPPPNLPGYVNNYAINSTIGGNYTQATGRVDGNLTENQRLFARYTWWHLNNPPNDPFHNGTGDPAQNNRSQQAVLGYTYAINPTTVLDVRLSWLYLHYYLTDQEGIDEAQFGPAWAALGQQMEFHILPEPNITGGYTNSTILASRNFQEHNFEDSTAFASITHIIGRHNVEFGGEFRTGKRFPALNVFNGSGQFFFNNGLTAETLAAQGSTGYGLASFVLGYAGSGSIGENQPVDHLLTAQGYYLLDNYQLSKKLQLNLGLRWDSPGAIRERNNLDSVFLPGLADPLGSFVNPIRGTQQQLVGQVVLVDSPQYPSRYERKQDAGLFSPRMGFAYALNPTRVVRGGYGISFTRTIGTDVGPRLSPINQATTTMVTSLNGGVTPANTLSDPFPDTTLNKPAGRNQAALSRLTEGLGFNQMVPFQPWSYAQSWNLSLQQEFSRSSVFTLSYAGSAGIHLSRNGGYNLNQLPDQYDSLGSQLLTATANPIAGRVTGALNNPTVPLGQLLVPFPQFQGIAAAQTFAGQSNYHALQSSFQQRLGAGGTFLASYTWSKFIDNVDSLSSGFLDPQIGVSQDYTDLKADRSESSFGAPHRFVGSYVVDLPVGRGKRFLQSPGAVTDKLVSGWQVNGITTFQQGYPVPIIAQGTVLQSSFYAGAPRPNIVPGCAKGIGGAQQAKLARWFNTSCFTQPSGYGFGNEPRTDSQVRDSGIDNYDFALMKTTPLFTERVRFQFTTEVFNLFNRVQFGPPGAQLGTGSFGVVSSQYNQPRLIQFAGRIVF